MRFLLTVLFVLGAHVSAAAGPCPDDAPACRPDIGTWTTTLQPRDFEGDGVVDAYYDTVLDLTWIRQPEHVYRNWFDSMSEVQQLVRFGGSDWRLPTLQPMNGEQLTNVAYANNGTRDYGSARAGIGWGRSSELGYMYYVHLGNPGICLPDDLAPEICAEDPTFFSIVNMGPFPFHRSDFYWTDRAWPQPPDDAPWRDPWDPFWSSFPSGFNGWWLRFGNGVQEPDAFGGGSALTWAVHPGDLIGFATSATEVPVSGPLATAFAIGLLGGIGGRQVSRRPPHTATPRSQAA